MDGLMVEMSGFAVTWLQIALMYYKLGKLEGKVVRLCEEINTMRRRRSGRQ